MLTSHALASNTLITPRNRFGATSKSVLSNQLSRVLDTPEKVDILIYLHGMKRGNINKLNGDPSGDLFTLVDYARMQDSLNSFEMIGEAFQTHSNLHGLDLALNAQSLLKETDPNNWSNPHFYFQGLQHILGYDH